jgi:hypothetical protein
MFKKDIYFYFNNEMVEPHHIFVLFRDPNPPDNDKSRLKSRAMATEWYRKNKFVSDLRQVSGFLGVLRFPPPIKLPAMI